MVKKKIWEPKECAKCKKWFIPWHHPQSFCQDPCKSKKMLSIEERNAEWATKEEENRKNPQRWNFRAGIANSRTRII